MNRTYLTVELRRIVRNRRAMLLYVAVPPVLFAVLGPDAPGPAGPFLVSLALYGAIMTAASGGASLAAEREQGWTRYLRLTPLRPTSYVATKIAAAMTIGAGSVLLTLAVGAGLGVRMPVAAWAGCALLAWLCSVPFAAFGLFLGELLPGEWAAQVLGPLTIVLGFAGGLFSPLGDGVLSDYGRLSPVYGAAVLARAPLGTGADGWAVGSVLVWSVLFVGAAAWRYRRGTERV